MPQSTSLTLEVDSFGPSNFQNASKRKSQEPFDLLAQRMREMGGMQGSAHLTRADSRTLHAATAFSSEQESTAIATDKVLNHISFVEAPEPQEKAQASLTSPNTSAATLGPIAAEDIVDLVIAKRNARAAASITPTPAVTTERAAPQAQSAAAAADAAAALNVDLVPQAKEAGAGSGVAEAASEGVEAPAIRLSGTDFIEWGSNSGNALFGASDKHQITARQYKVAVTTLPGFFTYDHTSATFFFDEQAASMLGVTWKNEGISFTEVMQMIRWVDRDLIMRFIQQPLSSEDDTMYFELHVVKGPMRGNKYYLNTGALLRDNKGELLLSSGFLSFISTDSKRATLHEGGKDGSWDWDGVTGQTHFSDSYKKMLGYEPNDPTFPTSFEQWAAELMHPDDKANTADKQLMVLASPDHGDNFECCVRLRHKDGHYIWTLGRGMVLGRDNKGHALRLSGTNTDIEFVRHNNDITRTVSWTDQLTGLQNRKYLDANRENYLQTDHSTLGCLFADVTGLKMLNDCLGHDAGDQLLRMAAKALRGAYNLPCDIIRYGGDEFLMMLPNCPKVQLEMLSFSIEGMCHGLSSEPGCMPLLMGCGVATLREGEGDISKMIALADQRAQENKKASHADDYRMLREYIAGQLGHEVDYRDSRTIHID